MGSALKPQHGGDHTHMRQFLPVAQGGARKGVNPNEIQNPSSAEAVCRSLSGVMGCGGRAAFAEPAQREPHMPIIGVSFGVFSRKP